MSFSCIQTQTIVAQLVHQCLGYNLLDTFDEYRKPILTREPDQVFNSVSALQAQINSRTDHNGAVYQLAGGNYPISTDIRLENVRNITIYSDPNNRARLDGQGTANFGVNAKVTIRNGRSGELIRVECNEVYNGSLANTGIASGEGIYIGSGNNEELYTDNVIIVGNDLHDLIAEAIDVKRHSKMIFIQHNTIDQINVNSQGAIVLGLDTNGQVQNYNAQMLVANNVISNVTSRAFNGNFVVVAVGGVRIFRNVMFNAADHGVAIYNDCDGVEKSVGVIENIIWGYSGLPVQENVTSGNNSPDNPCSVERSKNIVMNNAVKDECAEPASVFQGPLTTFAGFAPRAV